LRSETIKLERSNHMLTTHTSCTSDIIPSNAMNTSKRKAPAASPTRTVKRNKGTLQPEQSVAETQEAIDDDFDFLDGLGQGRSSSCTGFHDILTDSDRGRQSYRDLVHNTQAMSNDESKCRDAMLHVGSSIQGTRQGHTSGCSQTWTTLPPKSTNFRTNISGSGQVQLCARNDRVRASLHVGTRWTRQTD
jgi:hypothetical protein